LEANGDPFIITGRTPGTGYRQEFDGGGAFPGRAMGLVSGSDGQSSVGAGKLARATLNSVIPSSPAICTFERLCLTSLR